MPQPRGSTPPNALNCSGNASTSLAQDTTPNLGASSWPGPGPEFMPISGAKSLDDTHVNAEGRGQRILEPLTAPVEG